MAGKKYRAREKRVQKMGRDGLMEENLHTGKTRRAVSGRADAMRIGDRPMERPAGIMPEEENPEEGFKGRPFRDGFKNPGTGERYGGSRRGAEEESETGKAGNRKRRTKTGEPRSAEAPSSLEEDAGSTGWAEERGTAGDGEDPYSQRLRQDTYHTALRQDRGGQPFKQGRKQEGLGGDFRDSREPDTAGRRKQDMRRRQIRAQAGKTDMTREEARYRGGAGETQPEEAKEAQNLPAGTSTASYLDSEAAAAEEESAQEGALSHGSRGMQTARGHPGSALRDAPLYSGGLRPQGEGNREAFREEGTDSRQRLKETSSEMDGLDALKEEISSKRKKGRLNQEQRRAREEHRAFHSMMRAAW